MPHDDSTPMRARTSPLLVFVSYARHDRARMQKDVDECLRHVGHDVWYDLHLIAGRAFWEDICEAIRRCDLFVYVISADSDVSPWCAAELAYALELKLPVLPVRLDPADEVRAPKSLDTLQVLTNENPVIFGAQLPKTIRDLVAVSRPRREFLPTPKIPKVSLPEVYAAAREAQLDQREQRRMVKMLEYLVQEGDHGAEPEKLARLMLERPDLFDDVRPQFEALAPQPPETRSYHRWPPRVVLPAGATVVSVLIALWAVYLFGGGDVSTFITPTPTITQSPSVETVCPGLPVATVFVGDDGRCHGFTDGAASLAGFSDAQEIRDKQTTIFEKNRTDLGDGPLTSEDLTVVWFGSLATNGKRGYGSQLHQLQALQLAQLRWPGGADAPRVRVHVVVADAGVDMMYAERVAGLLVKARPTLGGRVVVVGGGDSRATTENAINSLLDDRIPFIAPTLTADWSGPGRPFIDRPGYLQLAAPNVTQAQAMVNLVARYTPERYLRKVLIYTEENPDLYQGASSPSDLYMASLARAVRDAARKGSRTQPAPAFVTQASALTDEVCRDPSDRRHGGVDSAAVIFAARATDFLDLDVKPGDEYHDFAHTIHTLCEKKGGPALVIADDAATRVMLDDSDRGRSALSFATWPMAFVAKGDQCDALEGARSSSPEAAALLQLAGTELTPRACVPVPSPDGHGTKVHQLGVSVSPTWDAVALANAVLPHSDALPVLADLATQQPFHGTSAEYDVQGGQITAWRSLDVPTTKKVPLPQDTPMRLYCVHSVGLVDGDRGRAVTFCDQAFQGLAGAR